MFKRISMYVLVASLILVSFIFYIASFEQRGWAPRVFSLFISLCTYIGAVIIARDYGILCAITEHKFKTYPIFDDMNWYICDCGYCEMHSKSLGSHLQKECKVKDHDPIH